MKNKTPIFKETVQPNKATKFASRPYFPSFKQINVLFGFPILLLMLILWGFRPAQAQESDSTPHTNSPNIAATASSDNQGYTLPDDQYENLGARAEWMRGAYGLTWQPRNLGNGDPETFDIQPFLDQFEHLATLDYVQIKLGGAYINSPKHTAPNTILESLWDADTEIDVLGNPTQNLIVPRASAGKDPFLDALQKTKAAGLKTQVYINGSNMINFTDGTQNADDIPDIQDRWMTWVDDNESTYYPDGMPSYYTMDGYPYRKYSFVYADVILKEYAIRYGDLIDAWVIDGAERNFYANGDFNANTQGVNLDKVRLYQAFANAIHAGNLDAAIAFNNGKGSTLAYRSPYSRATSFCDYSFGHPFGGGKNLRDVTGNYKLRDYTIARDGYVYDENRYYDPSSDDPERYQAIDENRSWDDNMVGHYYPPMSTTSWSGGNTPAFPQDEFVNDWYGPMLIHGAAVSFGVPHIKPNGTDPEDRLMQPYALADLEALDTHLKANQDVGPPVWARYHDSFPDVEAGHFFYHELELGKDFWDPENAFHDVTIATDIPTASSLSEQMVESVPDWLTLSQSPANPDIWVLSGLVTNTVPTEYSIALRLSDEAGEIADRQFSLNVTRTIPDLADLGDLPEGSPVSHAELGPNHTQPTDSSATVWLGVASPDYESDGVHNSEALGDNFSSNDDEDGFSTSGSIGPGETINTSLLVNGTDDSADVGYWIDWNANGSFDDPDDFFEFYDNYPTGASSYINETITVPVSLTEPIASPRVRLRVYPASFATEADYAMLVFPMGGVENGEIEDHLIMHAPTTVSLQAGDASNGNNSVILILILGVLAGLLVFGAVSVVRVRRQ